MILTFRQAVSQIKGILAASVFHKQYIIVESV